GCHLQRAHHRRAHSARAPRREVQGRAGRRGPAVEPAPLRPGRNPDPVPRHQAGRHDPRRPEPGLMLRPALVLLALFTLLTGVVYPVAITGIAQLAFPRQANGSVITVDGTAAGSRL